MKADILTIFPGFFQGPLDHGITRRACEMGLAKIEVHDLRRFTHDKHRTVDDRPFGGGGRLSVAENGVGGWIMLMHGTGGGGGGAAWMWYFTRCGLLMRMKIGF